MAEQQQYKREVAYRINSGAMKELVVVPRDGDDEYAPQYFSMLDGTKINRVFIVGALIGLGDIGSDTPFWKLKISDMQGVFSATIGQYSPLHAQNNIEKLSIPCFVAVVGKVKSNEYEDKTYFSIAVESITEVDEHTYDMWIAETEAKTSVRQGENDANR